MSGGNNYTNLTSSALSASADSRKKYYGVLAVLTSLGCLTGFLMNAFTLVSFRVIRRPVPPVVGIILSLAFADMIASIVVGATSFYNEFPVYLGVVKNMSDAGKILERVITLAYHSVSIIPIAHVTLLEINRWVLTIYPVEYGKIFTKKLVKAIIVILWIAALSLIFGYFGIRTDESFFYNDWANRSYKFNRDMTWRNVMAGLTFLPFTLIVGLHIHLHLYFRRPARRQLVQQKLLNGNSWPLKHLTMAVLGSYIFGWMPSNLLYILLCKHCFVSPQQVPTVINDYHNLKFLLAALNPIFNNVVYAWNSPRLKPAMEKLGKNHNNRQRRSNQTGTDPRPARHRPARTTRSPAVETAV